MSVVTQNQKQEQPVVNEKNRLGGFRSPTLPLLEGTNSSLDQQSSTGQTSSTPLQPLSVKKPTTGSSGGADKAAPADPAAQQSRPATQPTPAPQAAKPVAPVKPTSGSATKGAPAPAKAEPFVFTKAGSPDVIARGGVVDPSTVGKDIAAEAIEAAFISRTAAAAFAAAHQAAQESGEISKTESGANTRSQPTFGLANRNNLATKQGAPLPPWKDSEETVVAVARITGESRELAARYSRMMADQKLPKAPTDEDVVRGMALYKQSFAVATEKWDSIYPTLEKGRTSEFDQKRAFQLDQASESARVGAVRATPQSQTPAAEEGASAAAPQLPPNSLLPQGATGPAWVGGRFQTRAELDTGRAVPTSSNIQEFSQGVYEELKNKYYDENYWKQWVSDSRRGVAPQFGIWSSSTRVTINTTVSDHEGLIRTFQNREREAAARGENPDVFRIQQRNGAIEVDRAAWIAVLSMESYEKASRFNRSMDGKFGFGPFNTYGAVGVQIRHYMSLLDSAEQSAATKINKLNASLISKDGTGYKNDEKAFAKFGEEVFDAVQDADKARKKAFASAYGAAGKGLGGIFGPITGVVFQPQPGETYGFGNGAVVISGGAITVR